MADFDGLLLRRRFAAVIALLACASVLLLAWLGYVAVRQWQRSVELLADRQSDESSELLLTALNRDMQGVQRSVLLSPGVEAFTLQPSYDAANAVASAFARYRYPESFILWKAEQGEDALQFFNRRERLPPWSQPAGGPNRFPVVIERSQTLGRTFLERIRSDAANGRRFSVFETDVAGTPYQVVTRIFYADPLRQELESVFGFTVNLAWVRQHYFDAIVRDAATTAARGDIVLAIVDDKGRRVASSGPMPPGGGPRLAARPFQLFFFSPLLIASDPAPDVDRQRWSAEALLREDGPLTAAIAAADRLLVLQGIAALTLGLGLVLTIRAARATLRLTELRSDFVSSVTHEFKTPLATIRTSGETLASARLEDPQMRQRYGRVIVHETRRLARLVDNLLAFSRITDTVPVRTHFDVVDVRELIDGTVQRFQLLLADGQFDVVIDVPPDVPPVWGDGSALALVLDNLVDNAIRHSRTGHRLVVRAYPRGDIVSFEVEDSGEGIAADEIAHVTRKFYRGRNAGHGGTGLGLAIASRVAADHGGSLSVRSAPEGGTTVRVDIPRAPIAELPTRLAASVHSGID